MATNIKTLNVDLLVKDELVYEAILRGIVLSGVETVRDLRKALRKSLKNYDLPNVKNLHAKVTVVSEFELITRKIKGLLVDIPDLITKEYVGSLDVARLETKLQHIRTRLHNLQYFDIGADNKEMAETLQKQVSELCVDLETIKDKVGEEKINQAIEQLSESNIEEENLLTPNNISPKSSNEQLHKVPKSKDNLQHSTPHQTNEIATNQMSTPYQHSVTMCAPLPNPITHHLKNFKTTNGLNTADFLNFLKNVLKLKDVTRLSDSELLDIIINYTEGPLFSKLLELKCTTPDLNTIHEGLLSYFLPLALRENLKKELVLRPQYSNEPLSIYIDTVKTNSRVLKLNYTEQDLVQSIKFGINQADRAKLVFMPNPQVFADLDKIVIDCHNVMFLDYERHNRELSLRQQSDVNLQSKSNHSQVKNCEVCKRRGHLAQNCFKNPKSLNYRPNFQISKN